MAVVRSRCLLAAGARVRAYDPAVTQTVGGIEMAAGACDAARGADVLCVLTEWPEFTQVDLRRVRLVMASPRIVDARNLLCPLAVEALGFTYDGIGRPNPAPPVTVDLTLSGEAIAGPVSAFRS